MAGQSRSETLTDKFIRRPTSPGDRVEYSDTICQGLRLRVSHPDRRVFAFKGRGSDRKLRTITIGSYPSVSLKAAREAAEEIRRVLRNGGDPNAEKRALRMPKAPCPTLRVILDEYQAKRRDLRATWRPRPGYPQGEARKRIETVFRQLLDRSVEDITERDLAKAMADYEPFSKNRSGNGQVSRARSYLSPVLDWVGGRGAFKKVGAGRPERITPANVAETHDPASDDPSIEGVRERALHQVELERILPLLVCPAPRALGMKTEPGVDVRPLAHRFILLTACRLDEVASMRWRDVDRRTRIWHKPEIKTTRGKPRSQDLPLSNAAWELLESLPRRKRAKPEDLVFTLDGEAKLGNWNRITRAIQRESGTHDWHRHDLRRTASTIMLAIGIQPFVVGHILGHTQPWRGEDVSASLKNYAILGQFLRDHEDPQRTALNRLAEVLSRIEAYAHLEIRDESAPQFEMTEVEPAGLVIGITGRCPTPGAAEVRRRS